jgi:hypothetical protein
MTSRQTEAADAAITSMHRLLDSSDAAVGRLAEFAHVTGPNYPVISQKAANLGMLIAGGRYSKQDISDFAAEIEAWIKAPGKPNTDG